MIKHLSQTPNIQSTPRPQRERKPTCEKDSYTNGLTCFEFVFFPSSFNDLNEINPDIDGIKHVTAPLSSQSVLSHDTKQTDIGYDVGRWYNYAEFKKNKLYKSVEMRIYLQRQAGGYVETGGGCRKARVRIIKRDTAIWGGIWCSYS